MDEKHQTKEPEYILADEKEREEFLSHIGNFSSPERELFHKLAAAWQPLIPWERFVANAGLGISAGMQDLERLLNKLRTARIGLITTRYKEGSRHRQGIILARENSKRFWAAMVDEAFESLYESISHPLPLEGNLKEEGIDVPDHYLTTLDSEGIVHAMSPDSSEERAIYRIPSLEGEHLIVTSSNIRRFIGIAIAKIRYHLQSTNLLSETARVLDTSLMDIKNQVQNREPSFWLSFTGKVLQSRKVFASKGLKVGKSFYHCAQLLKLLIDGQIQDARKKKQEREERELDMKQLLEEMRQLEKPLCVQQEFTGRLEQFKEKYEDQFKDFQEAFYERFVKSQGKRTLPRIVIVDKGYIHRDRLYPHFYERFLDAASVLDQEYVDEMTRQLKTGNRNNSEIFYSKESFESDIESRVERIDSFVASLLKKPGMLGESIIHTAKQQKAAKTVDDLKDKLEAYFQPNSMRLKSYASVFALNLFEIFERAFTRLHVLHQLWIRITGKYESYKERYVGDYREDIRNRKQRGESLSQPTSRARRSSDTAEGGSPAERLARRTRTADASAGTASAGSGAGGGAGGRGAGAARRGRGSGRPSGAGTESPSRSSRRSAPPRKVERKPNPKHADDAWKDFSEGLSKLDDN